MSFYVRDFKALKIREKIFLFFTHKIVIIQNFSYLRPIKRKFMNLLQRLFGPRVRNWVPMHEAIFIMSLALEDGIPFDPESAFVAYTYIDSYGVKHEFYADIDTLAQSAFDLLEVLPGFISGTSPYVDADKFIGAVSDLFQNEPETLADYYHLRGLDRELFFSIIQKSDLSLRFDECVNNYRALAAELQNIGL